MLGASRAGRAAAENLAALAGPSALVALTAPAAPRPSNAAGCQCTGARPHPAAGPGRAAPEDTLGWRWPPNGLVRARTAAGAASQSPGPRLKAPSTGQWAAAGLPLPPGCPSTPAKRFRPGPGHGQGTAGALSRVGGRGPRWGRAQRSRRRGANGTRSTSTVTLSTGDRAAPAGDPTVLARTFQEDSAIRRSRSLLNVSTKGNNAFSALKERRLFLRSSKLHEKH